MVGGIIAIASIKVSHEPDINMDAKAEFVNKEVPGERPAVLQS
jgi:hypothetical protein